MTERIARARDAQEVAGADTLLGKIADLEATARRLLTKSEKRGKLGVSVAALRELRGVVELLARVTGELKGSGGVTVNILGSPEWFSLQRKILEALAPFPEARLSVARALLPAGNGGGPPDA